MLDTCVLVDVLRGRQAALDWMLKAAAQPMAVSAMTVAELYVGATTPARVRAARELLDVMETISIDGGIAQRAAAWRRRYGPSHGVGLADTLIAATAQASRKTFVTVNVRHFPMLSKVVQPY